MTYPVTGPLTTSTYSDWIGPFAGRLSQKTRYRQKRPYNLSLPYRSLSYRVTQWGQPSYNPANGGDDRAKPRPISSVQWMVDAAYAKATSRLDAKMGESASLIVSLAERKQAMSMMTKRLVQLAEFAVHLRRFDWKRAAKSIGIFRSPEKTKIFLKKLREKKFDRAHKSFANNYLEFHFGWSPLAGDIYSATQILSNPVKDEKIRGTCTIKDVTRTITGYYNNWYSTFSNQVRVAISCFARVSNPNLALANRLGLVNLALVPFELISYSFVLDWFVNVSEFIGQFTAFAGIDLVDLQHCVKNVASNELYITDPWPDAPCKAELVEFQRFIGPLPFVTLKKRPPWNLSPRRGLAAISLLIQKMS